MTDDVICRFLEMPHSNRKLRSTVFFLFMETIRNDNKKTDSKSLCHAVVQGVIASATAATHQRFYVRLLYPLPSDNKSCKYLRCKVATDESFNCTKLVTFIDQNAKYLVLLGFTSIVWTIIQTIAFELMLIILVFTD